MPTVLAMHMANELLNPQVAAATLVLAAVIVTGASLRASRALPSEKAPLMGVMGAFVFAAQMINFTLPGMPGTSGHLGGGVLLAILLGPAAGILTMTGILIIQCLLFQDGGLLALGCNILNMGVVPCLLGWGVYRLLLGPAGTAKAARQYLAAWAACMVGVAGGAALVPIQARLSGVLRIGLAEFLQVMIGVHLLIGFVEGAITFAVVAYLRKVRPAALGLGSGESKGGRLSRRSVAVSLLATALLLAGVVSWFASTHPDGLEWSYKEHLTREGRTVVDNPSPLVSAVESFQTQWTPLSDYSKRPAPLGQEPSPQVEVEGPSQSAWPNVDGWGSLAGVIGTLVTLAALYLVAWKLRRRTTKSAPFQAAQSS